MRFHEIHWLCVETSNPDADQQDGRTSQFVIDEAADGDPEAARLRLEVFDGIPLLPHSECVEQIAEELIRRSSVPEKAKLDGLHIASAAVGGVHYLLTQNCWHIANAHVLPRIYDYLFRVRHPEPLRWSRTAWKRERRRAVSRHHSVVYNLRSDPAGTANPAEENPAQL